MKTPEQYAQALMDCYASAGGYTVTLKRFESAFREAGAEAREECARICDEIACGAGDYSSAGRSAQRIRALGESPGYNFKYPPPPAAPSMEDMMRKRIREITDLENRLLVLENWHDRTVQACKPPIA